MEEKEMSVELKNELIGLGKQAAISVGLFILGMALFGDESMALIFCFVPYGWSALNKLTPGVLLCLPLVGWVIFYISKFLLSALVGMFIMAYKWIRCIVRVIMAYGRQIQ
jgi:hypothetical protein